MFERFSDGAIGAIMLAQEKARQLGAREIDADYIIYGLIEEGSSPVARLLRLNGFQGRLEEKLKSKSTHAQSLPVGTEIPFSREMIEVFTEGTFSGNSDLINTVRLTTMMLALPASENFRDAITQSSLRLKDSARDQIQNSDLPSLQNNSNPTPPRTLKDWFTAETIRVMATAEETARTAGSSTISADHLLLALAKECSWTPKQIKSACQPIITVGEKKAGRRGNTTSKISFGSEIATVFIEAQSAASELGKSNIAPEDLFAGLLKSLANGSAEAQLINQTTAEEFYPSLKLAASNHLKELISARPRQKVEPLFADENIVRATNRFIETVKNARQLALSQKRSVTITDLAKALIQTAQASEISFVENHASALNEAREKLTQSKQFTRKKLPRSSPVLDEIGRQALAHAERLQSNRLDINHLGLALLDQDDQSVDLLIKAFGDNATRSVLRRRLEWCLFYQKFQPGYQEEAGVLLNINNIENL